MDIVLKIIIEIGLSGSKEIFAEFTFFDYCYFALVVQSNADD